MPATPDPTQAWPLSAALRRRSACFIRRIHEVYPLLRPCCRSLLRTVSFITEPGLIRRILDHLANSAQEDRPPPPSQPVQTPA